MVTQPADETEPDDLGRLEHQLGPFAIVPEWVIDADVSDRACRLYAVLVRAAGSKGSAWPGRKTLATRLRCSPSAVDRAVRELRDLGAVEVLERFSATGRRTSNLYRVRFDPSPPVVRDLITGDEVPLVTRDEVTTLTESKKEREEVLRTSPASSPAVELFDAWWPVYPRRVGKRAALAAYRRALARVDYDSSVLLEGARRYRDDPNRRDAFTAHPTTWLNRDGWLDEPLPPRGPEGFTPDAWPSGSGYDNPPRPL